MVLYKDILLLVLLFKPGLNLFWFMLFEFILLLCAYFQSFEIFLSFFFFDTFNLPETCTIDSCGRMASISPFLLEFLFRAIRTTNFLSFPAEKLRFHAKLGGYLFTSATCTISFLGR